MEVLGVIPAREGSTRLKGKPLVDLCGRPLILWTLKGARQAKKLTRVVVATDSEKIKEVVEGAGGEAIMTSPHHRSGTERLGEVAQNIHYQGYLNIQADEPMIKGEALDLLVEELERGEDFVSLYGELHPEEAEDPNTVKVVLDEEGYSLYFSRSPVPFRGPYLKHIGIYGFRREALMWFLSRDPSPLEASEGLEQMRILYYGKKIKMVPWKEPTVSVDTQKDLIKLREVLCGKAD